MTKEEIQQKVVKFVPELNQPLVLDLIELAYVVGGLDEIRRQIEQVKKINL